MGISSNGKYFGINQTIAYSSVLGSLTYIKWQASEAKKYLVTINDETREMSATSGSSSALEPTIELTSYLFARHGNNGVQTYDGLGTKIYFHREYLEDGTIQMNLIPCYRKSDDEPGMYDTVTNTFFTNQGTGEFTVGQDVDILNTKIENILADKMTNIKSGNIKDGVNILGILGSYEGLDTSDANATANDIVTNKTAYVNGQKIAGNLVINKYYTGSGSPSSSLGNDGDLYLQV